MSRVAKKPINLPKGVELNIQPESVSVKGPKGTLSLNKAAGVEISIDNGVVTLNPKDISFDALTGTVRAILANMVQGYRAAMQGKDLNLSLGFSHPVVFVAPEGITLSTPTQTEIVVQGADKQVVGEVAAKIRGYRPPEPYKGKGVKYAGEVIIRKEAKKA
jgi:large subunit ribosomal protein L6